MFNLKSEKVTIGFLVVFCLVFFNFNHFSLAESEDNSEKSEDSSKPDDDKIDEYENKKEEIEAEIKKIEKQKNELQKDLSAVQQSLLSTQQSLTQTKKEIESKNLEIEKNNKQIEQLNQKTELYQKALSSALRDFYYAQQNKPTFLLAFEGDSNSGFLSTNNNLDVLQGEILDLIGEIDETKSTIQTKKDDLEKLKVDQEELLSLKEDQQQSLLSEKNQTQKDIYQKEATISELNAKLAKVESDISSLLGGSVKEGDIVSAVKFASSKTGVDKNFLFGMLVVETDLGRYTGKCTFANCRMNEARKKAFIQIAEKLGRDYKKLKVSCPPSNYVGTGGAMGVSQFMSDTWLGYESRIAKNTGHKNPDPWSLTDGVMAMALKLANDGALNGTSGECTAAKRYLGGNHQWYCDKVMYWAKNYKDKLK